MKRFFLTFTLSIPIPLFAADSTWIVDASTIAYHANHAFHNTVGQTSAAKGKGVCAASGCDFLIAVPVKAFDSGDHNRDLHMIQAVKGGDFPIVSVRTHTDQEPASDFKADLTVDFGGKQIVYPGVSIQISEKTASGFHSKCVVPLQLTRHNVKRPSLMGVAVKDNAPVDVDIVWKKGN